MSTETHGASHSKKSKKAKAFYAIAFIILLIGFINWIQGSLKAAKKEEDQKKSVSKVQQPNVEYLEITTEDQGYNLDYVGHRCDWTFVKKGTYIVTDIDGAEHRYNKSKHEWDIPLDLSTGKYRVRMEEGVGEIKKEIIF